MRLRSALVWSLLLHLAVASLFVFLPGIEGNRGTARALQAALLPKISGESLQQGGRQVAGPHVPTLPAKSTIPTPRPLLTQAGAGPTVPAQAAAASASESISTAPLAESRRALEAPAAEAPREAISAEGLRQYRVNLAREARRYRQYPAIARARGWEGTVELRVEVNVGMPPAVGLAKSSGYEMLDEQAVEMMGRAVLAVILPESLRGRSFSLPVPVRFSLED